MKKYKPILIAFLLLAFSCKDEEVVKETVFLNEADLSGKVKSISYSYDQSTIKYNYNYDELLLNSIEIEDITNETKKVAQLVFDPDSVIVKLENEQDVTTFNYNENTQLHQITQQTGTEEEIVSSFDRGIDGKLERFEQYSIDEVNQRKTTLLRLDMSWESGSLRKYTKLGLGIEKDEVTIQAENRQSKIREVCLKHGVFLPLLPFLVSNSIIEERPLFSNSYYRHTELFDEFGNPTQLIITDVSTNTELLNLTLEYH